MKRSAPCVAALFFAGLLQAVSSLSQGVVLPPEEPLKIDAVAGVSHLLNKPELAYPEAARQRHIEGKVELELTVSPQGDVISERAISGPLALQQPAMDSLRRAKYIPFLRNLEPSAAVVQVIIAYEKDHATISTQSEHAPIGNDLSPSKAVREAAARASGIGSGGDGENEGENLGPGIGAHGRQGGDLTVLSDTQGIDFGPYLQGVLHAVRKNWYPLIPQSAQWKRGNLVVGFAIMKDGRVQGLKIVTSSNDIALDRPAFGSIAASSPFPPLPGDFTGQYLALRVRFRYNPAKGDIAPTEPATPSSGVK